MFASFNPNALILSITTPTLAGDAIAATKAKAIDPQIVTLTKGAHFLQLDRQALEQYPQFDLVMRGEYEETVQELSSGNPWNEIHGITYRNGQEIVRNPDRGFIPGRRFHSISPPVI
jgi:radical SAM superfamily enzyme YgiQ (UPF0313 family)